MAKMQPARTARPPSRLARWLGIGVAVVVLLLVVLLFVGNHLLKTWGAEALAKEVPADRWTIRTGFLTPLQLLLGMGVDGRVEGHGVHPKDAPTLARLTVDVRGLAVSVGSRSVKRCAAADVEVFLGAKEVTEFVQKETSAGALQGLTVNIEEGKLKMAGTASLDVGPLFGGASLSAKFEGEATPQVVPPATLALDLQRVTADMGSGKRELGSLERQGLGLMGFRYDASKLLPGLTLQSCRVEQGGITITGSLDPQVLLKH
ncbi:MAG: LmeA family phospholipid-binding protein [Armatimonadetes bacterium]|nr:LmeA family phospholipid-binding protein [Armatimonadota bacterium]